jgi:hypothetical protein
MINETWPTTLQALNRFLLDRGTEGTLEVGYRCNLQTYRELANSVGEPRGNSFRLFSLSGVYISIDPLLPDGVFWPESRYRNASAIDLLLRALPRTFTREADQPEEVEDAKSTEEAKEAK